MTSLAEALAEIDASIARTETNETLAEEAARLSGSLGLFTRGAWHIVEPKQQFVSGWHIDAISEKLEACTAGEIQRLLINVPPRHMKSLAVSVMWPVWTWTRRPETRFLTASYGDSLATRDAVKSRRILQHPWFTSRFGEVFHLTSDQNQKTRYENDRTGYRIATSVGGGATGEGGDIIVIDDPHKSDEAESEVLRNAVIEWHGGVIASRFNDPNTGIEVVIMQRLHQLDLSGHLLAQGGWEHLCLPAEYVRKHPFVWPDDPRKRDGDLLWQERFGPPAMKRLKTELGSAYVIAGQLQQLPAPREGGMLKRANWRYYDPDLSYYSPRAAFGPEQVTELASRVGPFQLIGHFWDTSVKDREHSDYVSGGTWGCVGANRYLLRLWHGRAALNATIVAMLEMYNWAEPLWPNCPHYVVIENTANGPDAAATIRSKIQGVVVANAKGSKVVRADAASPALDGFNCFLPGHPLDDGTGYDPRTPDAVQDFVEELAIFDKGVNDDQVDMWSSMVLWTRGRTGGVDMGVPSGETNAPRFRAGENVTKLRPTMR